MFCGKTDRGLTSLCVAFKSMIQLHAIYAAKHCLEDVEEWKWTRRYAYNSEKVGNMVRAYHLSRDNGPKYKFGVQIPRSIKQAMSLDAKNKNTLWEEAIAKERKRIAEYDTFHALGGLGDVPPGYTKIPYHFVFDVKFDGRRKARLVAGGNKVEPPKDDTYSGVIGMEAIRTLFLLAAMNDLDL